MSTQIKLTSKISTNPEEINSQLNSIPSAFNTPQFSFAIRDLPPLNLDEIIAQTKCNDELMMGQNTNDCQNLFNNNKMLPRMLLPPSKNKLSLLSQLSASLNEESSEKDRTISNETVGLNSTAELTPRAANTNYSTNPFQRDGSFSPIRDVEFSERQAPLSTEKPIPYTGLILSKFNNTNNQQSQVSLNGELKRNLFCSIPQQPLTPTSSSADRTLRDIKNFKMIGKVGEGSYGQVWSALHNPSQRLYAIKVIQKSRVEKLDKVQEIQNEKNILSRLKHPNIVKLHSTFTDAKNVYMVLDYAINGDFSQYLKLNKTLNEKQAKFYVSQLITILSFLRSKRIIHRDLKPANILFDDNWHLILADFGTAKIITPRKISDASSTQNKSQNTSLNNSANTTPKSSSTSLGMIMQNDQGEMSPFAQQTLNRVASSANDVINMSKQNEIVSNNMDELLSNADMDQENKGSFVGTEDYVSPEVINNQEPSFATDLWSLGIIIYQFFTGKTPFKGATPFYTFENILACEYSISQQVPEHAKDLIQKLLVLDPQRRLGAGDEDSDIGLEQLKQHPFFEGINFHTLHTDKAPIETRHIIQSPLRKQLMHYLPSSQSSKSQHLTQEFQNDILNPECNGQSTNERSTTGIRDFSDLVKLQKVPSNMNIKRIQEFDLNDLKLLKAQSTNNLVEEMGYQHKNPKGKSKRIPIKKTSNVFEDRDHLNQQLFKSHAAPTKQFSVIKDSDLFFDDCIDCIQLWKEAKSEMVKKKTKLIFYADRLLKLYENGYFAYFTSRHKDLKAVIHPKDIISCLLESKDKMKLSTKEKSYLFKFNDPKVAQEWVNSINISISKAQQSQI